MLNLYTLINSLIEPICPCFVDHYPEDEAKVFPYAEIQFPNSLPNNTFSDNNLLSITIWDDKSTDITEIEGIADAIHKALNRLQYNDMTMYVSINRNTPYRLVLPDPIIHIQRRELRYISTVYYKQTG
jgi:hypothetical protein